MGNQENVVEFIKKNLLIICCAVMLGSSLLLDFIVSYYNGGKTSGITLFTCITGVRDMSTGREIGGVSFYALVLIAIPIFILFFKKIQQVQKYERLLKLILPVVAIIFSFVIKNNISRGFDGSYFLLGNDSSGFGIGAWVYLLASFGLLYIGIKEYTNISESKEKLSEKDSDISNGNSKENIS